MAANKRDINPTVIDLFAGAEGLPLGLYQAGWENVFSVEN